MSKYVWVNIKNNNRRNCGYIPLKSNLKIGSMVEMIDIDGEFWEVMTISNPVDKSIIRENEKQHKNWRSVTDI